MSKHLFYSKVKSCVYLLRFMTLQPIGRNRRALPRASNECLTLFYLFLDQIRFFILFSEKKIIVEKTLKIDLSHSLVFTKYFNKYLSD